jgi:hypothetical protein
MRTNAAFEATSNLMCSPFDNSASKALDLTIQITFADGQVKLTAEQESRIKAWRSRWSAAPGKLDVLLSGACHTARVIRLRRLNSLINFLLQLGIAAKRIFTELEWTRPARMGSLDHIPPDTIWLKFCLHSRHRSVV